MGKRKGRERRNARINTSFSTRGERLLYQFGLAIGELHVAGMINRLAMYCVENPEVIEHFMLTMNQPKNAHNRITGFRLNAWNEIEYLIGPQEKRYVEGGPGMRFSRVEVSPYDERYATAKPNEKPTPELQRQK